MPEGSPGFVLPEGCSATVVVINQRKWSLRHWQRTGIVPCSGSVLEGIFLDNGSGKRSSMNNCLGMLSCQCSA